MSEKDVQNQPEVKSLFKSAADREPVESEEKNVWTGRVLLIVVLLSIICGCLYYVGGGQTEVTQVRMLMVSQSQVFQLIGHSDRWQQWNSMVLDVDGAQGDLAVGQSYVIKTSVLGVPFTEIWTITAATENSRVAFDIVSPIRKSELDISLEAGQGGVVVNIYYVTEYSGMEKNDRSVCFRVEDDKNESAEPSQTGGGNSSS